VLRVLSQLAIAVAVVCGPPLAGWCSAQSYGARSSLRQQAYYQQAEEETIAPGRISESINRSMSGDQDGSVMWDDSGDFFEYGPGDCDYCESVDDGESIIPDGFWFNRGPLWYSSAAVTLLQKAAATHQATALPIAQALEEVLVNGQVIVLRPQVMGTSALDTRVTPGLRLTVGRNLYEDILKRQHSVEFDFLGLTNWQTSGFALGTPGFQTQTSLKFANLFSLFPFSVGGFTNATQMRISERSQFNNYEMNYRLTSLPRPDRMAQFPDGRWMQVGTPCMTHSLLAGLRVVTFNDQFHWFSTGNGTNGPFDGTYNVNTSNTLLGAQMGGDLNMNYNVWTLGIRSKAGVYHNFTKQSSDVQIIDPTAGNSAGSGMGKVGTTAFVGDLGFLSTVRLAERAYFRFSYDFLWIAGIANAPEQLQYTTDIAPVVRKNGHLLFQGASLGFDFCW